MLLMRFFAVNAQLRAAYAQPHDELSIYWVQGSPLPREA